MRKIFCDLDGVLVDFEAGFLRNYGFAHDSVAEPVMWKFINQNKNHWENLPPMPDAHLLWAFIRPMSPSILTGCPRSGYDAAHEGKHVWCKSNLEDVGEIITCLSRNKPIHMVSPGDILIDDLTKNIKRWNEAGGFGILHTSAENTIEQLKTALGI